MLHHPLHGQALTPSAASKPIAPLPQIKLRAPRPAPETAPSQVALPQAKFGFGQITFMDGTPFVPPKDYAAPEDPSYKDSTPFLAPQTGPTFLEIGNDVIEVAPTSCKRAREESPPTFASDDFESFSDIYLWDVFVDGKDTPRQLGERAVKHCGMDPKVVIGCQMWRNHEKVLSIRFNGEKAAHRFFSIMKGDECPPLMKNLHVATPKMFGKRPEKKAANTRKNPCRTLLAWNIDGRLALKLTDPDFVEIVKEADIVFIQETFMRNDEELTLDLPQGYDVVARARPDIPGSNAIWGGVTVLIRRGIEYRVVEHLTAPDIIVLDLGNMFFVGSYVLPAGSNWQAWTDIDPKIRLAEALTYCSSAPSKPLLAMGDINARIANLTPSTSPYKRLSSDDKEADTRGRWLLALCKGLNLVILNGTIKEAAVPGAFTSFQPRGATVIDFAICSPSLLERLETGALVIARQAKWSDHATLSIEVAADRVPEVPRFPRAPPMQFPGETKLDRLAADAVRAGVDSEGHAARLYGLVYDRGSPTSAYISAFAKGPHPAVCVATAAAYWGPPPSKPSPGRACNSAVRIPGAQNLERAGHWAVYLAISSAPKTRPLLIYTSFSWIIRAYCNSSSCTQLCVQKPGLPHGPMRGNPWVSHITDPE
uniref:Endonuclease/exonuclease/phosphatase domain-containing protein n=1 Tax=Mycena chlorophos TaxID=658473 RepID=A0ABQ0L8Y6_MYCCL|nr:predicted protein [Mycena chlorophos]